MEKLYRIELKYGVFGMLIENNKVVDSAPMGRWTVGKDINYVLNYYKKKGAVITEIK